MDTEAICWPGTPGSGDETTAVQNNDQFVEGDAPVLVSPQRNRVAARPRCEALYDTEAFTSAGTTTTFQLFQDSHHFQEFTSLFKTKTYLDTNQVGPGGSLPEGHYFRWFSFCSSLTYRVASITSAQSIDNKRMLWDSAFVQLMLGSTPYATIPFYRVTGGPGLIGPLSTGEPGITVGDIQMGWPDCCCCYDVTVPGTVRKNTPQGVKDIRCPRVPIEFAETESFGINIVFPTRPVIFTTPIFMTIRMNGVFLKPLAA